MADLDSTETQAAQAIDCLRGDASTGNQHLKILSHANGRDQVLKLEGYSRSLLRDVAILEGVGKLITLANAHQELRLRAEFFAAHTSLLARAAERGEIDMGGEVLLTGSLVGIGTGGVMAIRHERTSVTACELLLARVTVVDDQKQAAADGAGNLLHPLLRDDWYFDALAGFGMDAVAIEKFQFFGERREPSLMQPIIFEGDVEFAARVENLDGKSIEEFVGEDN